MNCNQRRMHSSHKKIIINNIDAHLILLTCKHRELLEASRLEANNRVHASYL